MDYARRMNHPPSLPKPRAPRSILRLATMAAIIVTLASLATVACDSVAHIYACDSPDPDTFAPDGGHDWCQCFHGCPCGDDYQYHDCLKYLDAGIGVDVDAGPSPGCAGRCLPEPPAGWTAPLLLWTGAETDAPDCPDVAEAVGYEGYAGLTAEPASCGACSCDPPAGTCGLPKTITASPADCGDTSPYQTVLEAPADWDGGCISPATIPAGALCGGTPCVNALTIPLPAVQEEGCAPMQAAAPQDPAAPSWSLFGRACATGAVGQCGTTGETCGPANAQGFLHCVYHDGDVACPSVSPYTDRLVFYQGIEDTRGCSACGCGSPEGSDCSAKLSVCKDAVCADCFEQTLIDSADPSGSKCHEVKLGVALGSMTIDSVTYTPGQCQPSGGEATGSATPSLPSTFCCLPSGSPR